MRHGTITGYNYHKCRCDECRAALTETHRKYRETHREERREQARAYYQRHREEILERIRVDQGKYEPGTLILKERYATLKAAVEDGWSYSEICRTYNTTQPTLIKHFGRSRFKSGHTPESSAIRKANAVIREMGDTL